MKKLLFGIFVFLVMSNYTSTAQLLIGKVENGSPVLTFEKASLLSSYNTNLAKASGIKGNFISVSIVTTESNGYLLVFKGEKYKSSFSVKLTDGKLFANDNLSCTTSDCASESFGCIPNFTSCTPCANLGKCSKTISLKSLLTGN